MADILSCVLFFLLGAHSVLCCDEERIQESKLCDVNQCLNHTCQYNKSCSHQLSPDLTHEDCTFFFEKNTPRCLSEKIPEYPIKQSDQPVQIQVYQYNDGHYIQPVFNVTMTDIKWNALKLKFSTGNDSACIDIYIKNSKSISTHWSIFYDCAWYDEQIEGKLVWLEYLATGNDFREMRKFSFITPLTMKLDPCNTSIQSHEVLTYLELTFTPYLTLHIQKLPADFQVYEYEVKKCFGTESSTHNNLQDCVHVDTVKAASNDNDNLMLPIDISEESGNFFFVIYANSSLCETGGCYISRTPTLTNKSLKDLVPWLVSGYILLMVLMMTGFVLWRKYVAKLLAAEFHVKRRRRILLLHEPLHRLHMHVVITLAEFLKENLNADVMLDIRDIPNSKSKDPLYWYNSAISSANFVAVIASPPWTDEHDAVYKDLHTVGLNFMKELLRSKTYKAQMFTIMLPYCNETGIPVLARHLKRIMLMQDIDSLVSLIHGNKRFRCGRYFCIRRFLLSKIQKNLKTQGKNLNNYIAEMMNITAQSGESGSVLRDSVQEELTFSKEIEKKSVFEVPEDEVFLDEGNTAKSNYMNYMEYNLSDLNLTGMQDSVLVVPKTQELVHNYEYCLDDLHL